MCIQTAIRMLMAVNGINMERLAKMMGLRGSGSIRNRFLGKSMGFDNALTMLNIMGYEIVVREIRTGRRREDEIVITLEDEE